MKKEAQKVHPIEACAMLFGESNQKEVKVQKIVTAPNRLRSTLRFEIDPEVVAKAFTEAEEEGLDFVGLFHSHPAPAKPSSIDLKYVKLWGDAFWLILSSTSGNLVAYQMKKSKVKEITLRIE